MTMANADDSKIKGDLTRAEGHEKASNSNHISQDAPSDLKPENAQTAAGQTGDNDKGKPYAFSDLDKASAAQPPGNIGFILDIPIEITVQLGHTKMLINEMLKLGQGSVIEFSKLAGETLDVLANQRLIARGEVVVVDEKYGIRLTEIVSPTERIESLK
jgi:flagellar motor switch protein FliN/FliY